MAEDPQYTDAQLADGTTLRFQGQLSPLEVKQKVTAYRAGLPSADSQSHNQLASTSMNKVDPMTGGQVTPQEEQVRDNYSHQAQNNIHTPVTNASLIYAAPILGSTPLASVGKFANSIGRGIFGDVVGRFGARELGADEDTQNLAGLALGTLGSVTGYKEPPARVGFGRYSFGVPDALRPAGAAQEAESAMGAFMNRGYKPAPASPTPLSPDYTVSSGVKDTPFTLPAPSGASSTSTGQSSVRYGEPPSQVDPLAQAVKNRTAAYLPTRMPAPPEVPEAIDPLASAVKNRTAAYLPTRMPTRAPVGAVTAPLAPEYSLSSGVRDTPFTLPAPSAEASSGTGGSVQYVKSLGTPGARSVTSGETATPSDSLDEQTFIVPEPNDFAPGEPNNMGSIPRSELPDLAQRLKAGAGSQLKSLGKTVLYLPRGSSR